MFKHHVRIFYINFKQYKTTFFINMIGLSTGLACSLLIYLWIYDEWKIDKFHEQRLYKVMVNDRQHDRITTGDAGSATVFITMIIAWLTIALQTIKASMVKPVECLKEK